MSLLPVSAIPSDGDYKINNSLRFRSSASATLSRTPSTVGNRSTWTWSAWIKRGRLTPSNGLGLFGAGTINSGTNETSIRFTANDELAMMNYRVTTRLFRDPSAWYHIVVAFDTTQATGNNRVKMYVNGVEETSFSTLANPTLNSTADFINSTTTHYMGVSFATTSLYDDRYQAETYFIDGQALTPSSFGETDTTTGVWKPKAYTGTYGTNGFYLKFSDATIGTPTLINTTTAVQNTSATTISVNVPAGTTNGDLMILLACSGSGTNTWTTPSGWTLWSPTTNANGRAIYYRTASSEPASYTITQSGSTTSNANILTYRNAAIDVMGTFPTSAANPAIAPSITTTENNAVVFFYIASPNVSSCTYTTPTNFTPLVSESDATTPSSAIFTRIQATAGATGTASSTASSGLPRAIQFSIKPASTNLGKDFGGNNNLWATNNISITSGTTYDAMTDSPTLTSATVGNYCTANPLDASPSGTSVLSNGNLTVNVSGSSAGGGYGGQARCNTINFTNVSGKWYWEAFIDNAGTGAATSRLTFFMDDEPVNISAQGGPWAWYWRADGLTDLTSPGSFATNDVVMFAYDSDTGKLWVGKNGTWSNSGVPSSGTGQVKTLTALTAYALGLNYGTSGGGTGTASFNFGQRPFAYTPPTGFSRLNAYNLPDSTIKKGNSYMDATLYTGTGATQSITGLNFQPGFVWMKGRSSATDHAIYDSVRGTTKDIGSNLNTQETTQSTGLTAFGSAGFTLGSLSKVNTNLDTYVAWTLKDGSSTVTNTDGTISSQVRANTAAGFNIITYTGTGANASVGHGLGVAPKLVLLKQRTGNASADWRVYHTALTGATEFLSLNLSSAVASTSGNFTAFPTSTVLNIGTQKEVNGSAATYVAYCFSEIAGFSKFGSYTGNGSNDGPFVYLGFRPKFLIIKQTNITRAWTLVDSSRNTTNIVNSELVPSASSAEATNSAAGGTYLDFLSNGFKLRGTASITNNSSGSYIYIAFAENPFKYSLAR